MTFEITPEQQKKLDNWEAEIDSRVLAEQKKQGVTEAILFDQAYYGACGGSLTYCFTPTSIGMVLVVKHSRGEEINLTDYDSW